MIKTTVPWFLVTMLFQHRVHRYSLKKKKKKEGCYICNLWALPSGLLGLIFFLIDNAHIQFFYWKNGCITCKYLAHLSCMFAFTWLLGLRSDERFCIFISCSQRRISCLLAIHVFLILDITDNWVETDLRWLELDLISWVSHTSSVACGISVALIC